MSADSKVLWRRSLVAIVLVLGLGALAGVLLRSITVGLAVGGASSLVVGLVAVIAGAQRPLPETRPQQEKSEGLGAAGRGWLLGLIFGASLGIIFSLALDSFAFLAVFLGAGMNIGLTIGAAIDRRHDNER